MVRQHHWLSGLEFEQTPGDIEWQRSLACCSPWGCKESDMTEQLNWTDSKWTLNKIVVVWSLSVVPLFATTWIAACQDPLSLAISQSLLKLMSIESVVPSNHLILGCPLLLLPSILPSIGVFSNESTLHIRWPNYWSFSFSLRPFNEYSGMISPKTDWFDLNVQGTLKGILQHRSSNASIRQCSAFFMVQISYLYVTTGKTIALVKQTFVTKAMSLLLICCLGL